MTAIFGLGGIGLNVIQGLRLAGADQIVGVDLNPDKVPMATKFGMTDFVNPTEVTGDLVGHLVELTGADRDRLRRFASEHDIVCLLQAGKPDRLEALAGSIAENGGEALAVPLDVTDSGSVAAAFDAAEKAYGVVDILANNASGC